MKNRWIADIRFIKGFIFFLKGWEKFAFDDKVVSFFSGAKLKSTQIDLKVYNRLVELVRDDKRQTICSVWPCRGVNNDAICEEPFRSVTHSYARNLLKYTVLGLTASTIKITEEHLLLLEERRKIPLCDSTKTSLYANLRGICMHFYLRDHKVL